MTSILLTGLAPSLLALGILLVPREQEQWLGAARTFALAAAGVIILAELVPSAIEGLGPLAMVVVAAGVVLPLALTRVIRATSARAAPHLGFEAGYAALWVHQLVDGLQMGALGSTLGTGVVLALASHGAPLVAAAVVACADHRDRAWALRRGLALVAAGALGIVVGSSVDPAWLAPIDPWLKAAVAGLLLHVLAHDLGAELPTTPFAKGLDLLALVAGVWLPLALLPPGHDHLGPDTSTALASLTVAAAPMFVVAVALAAIAGRRDEPILFSLRRHALAMGPWVAVGLIGAAWAQVHLGVGRVDLTGLPEGERQLAMFGVTAWVLRSLWHVSPRAWLAALLGDDGHSHD